METFKLRDDMPLKLSDFAVIKANWINKTQNIADLSDELNIGLESIVFIDDNPVECHLVKNVLPEVTTILLPKDPAVYPGVIDTLSFFEKTSILESDRTKTNSYKENRKRKALLDRTNDLKTYLNSLGTEISIRKPDKADFERVHQLFTKTNQFNVTTIRYSKPQINSMVEDRNNDLFIVDAQDKFGNLGSIGLYMVRYDNNNAIIDSFILSCRAMGRGIESAVMNQLKKRSFVERQVRHVNAKFCPTRKNKPVENFFDQQGFKVIKKEENGDKAYSLSLDSNKYIDCEWVKICNIKKG